MSDRPGNAAVRRVDVSAGVSSLERIKILLMAAGYPSVAAWARAVGERREACWQAVTGTRRNAVSDRILDKLAASVGKSRKTIDDLVAGEPDAVDQVASSDVAEDAGKNA